MDGNRRVKPETFVFIAYSVALAAALFLLMQTALHGVPADTAPPVRALLQRLPIRPGAAALSVLCTLLLAWFVWLVIDSLHTRREKMLAPVRREEKRLMKQSQQAAQQAMHAPGTVKPPVKRDNTATILAVVGIVILLAVCGLCSSVVPAPRPDQLNGPVISAILLITLPIWGGLIILFVKLHIARKKQSAHENLEDAQEYIQAREHQRQQAAARQLAAGPAPATPGGMGILGAPIIGDLPWCMNGWLTLPAPELEKHGVVIGGSGSGKTISLLRLAYVAATVYGYRVFYVDAKGDRDTAAQFLAMMNVAGVRPFQMFPRQAFNGWKGDGGALLNRLMAVESFSEPYYKAVTKKVLHVICNDPAGPPRSSAEFFTRFVDLDQRIKIDKRELAGIELRYAAFFDSLNGKLDGGWSWEDAQAGYILLDGLSLKEEAASLGRYLIEDFAHYAANRKQSGKDLLIIDEYSALSSGTDAANLVERLRSYGCAVVLSSQSYAGLGQPQDAERILDAANWLLLHRNAAPERLTARAGTAKNVQEQYQFGGDLDAQVHDRGRVSLQEEYTVHPDQARRLQTGEAILIAHGRYIKARIATPPPAPDAEIEAARTWIDQRQPQQSPTIHQPPRPGLPPVPPPAHLSQPRPGGGGTGPMFTLPQRSNTGTTGPQPAQQQSTGPHLPPPVSL